MHNFCGDCTLGKCPRPEEGSSATSEVGREVANHIRQIWLSHESEALSTKCNFAKGFPEAPFTVLAKANRASIQF